MCDTTDFLYDLILNTIQGGIDDTDTLYKNTFYLLHVLLYLKL